MIQSQEIRREVVQKVEQVNALRRQKAPGKEFTGTSCDAAKLKEHPELAIDYIVAPPRMALYMLKGMNLEEGATAKNRNAQIGEHKA